MRTTTNNYVNDSCDGGSTDAHHSAITHLDRFSRENGISSALPEVTEAAFGAAREAGHGASEKEAVFEVLKRRLV